MLLRIRDDALDLGTDLPKVALEGLDILELPVRLRLFDE